jgi:hypothetical protein
MQFGKIILVGESHFLTSVLLLIVLRYVHKELNTFSFQWHLHGHVNHSFPLCTQTNLVATPHTTANVYFLMSPNVDYSIRISSKIRSILIPGALG